MKIVIETSTLKKIAMVVLAFADAVFALLLLICVAAALTRDLHVTQYAQFDVGLICYIGARVFIRELVATRQSLDAEAGKS